MFSLLAHNKHDACAILSRLYVWNRRIDRTAVVQHRPHWRFWAPEKHAISSLSFGRFQWIQKQSMFSLLAHNKHDACAILSRLYVWNRRIDRTAVVQHRPHGCFGRKKGTFQTLRSNNSRTAAPFFNLKAHFIKQFELWIPRAERFPVSVLHGSSILLWKKVIDFCAKPRHVRRRAMLPASLRKRHASLTWIVSSCQDLTF